MIDYTKENEDRIYIYRNLNHNIICSYISYIAILITVKHFIFNQDYERSFNLTKVEGFPCYFTTFRQIVINEKLLNNLDGCIKEIVLSHICSEQRDEMIVKT